MERKILLNERLDNSCNNGGEAVLFRVVEESEEDDPDAIIRYIEIESICYGTHYTTVRIDSIGDLAKLGKALIKIS